MKRLLAVLFLALPAFAQTKESLTQRMSPKPSGTAGDIPYAVNTTTIGWIGHATGLQCLTQNGTATPTWAACGSGSSPLTTKGDLYTYSTLDARLGVGTNGYVLMADSTQATGLKWNDPNTSAIGWVRLQATYPGTQQTGHFNVDGSSGSGPYTVTYPLVGAGTYDLMTLTPNAANNVHDRFRIMFGDASAGAARQLRMDYLVPGTGEVASWQFGRADKNIGSGITMMQKNASLNMILCLATDSAAGAGYPAVCDAAGSAALAVGAIGAAPGLTVNNDGNVATLRGVTYSWPTSAPAGAACMRSTGGILTWDTACGSGGTGGVTSVALSAPSIFTVSNSPVTTTGTLTFTLNTQSANTAFMGPTSGGAATPTFRSLVSADIPNNAADTSGKSATTDAMNTTGAAVNVSLSPAPSGVNQACVTTDATHCTWQTITTAGGTGNVTVTTKGDIQTFSTTPANLSVGTDGQMVTADSTASTGLSYQWPGIGTLKVLKETVFAGITPASYSTGTTTTIDGSGYTCTLAGNGTIDIVATGLRLRQGTTSGTGVQNFKIAAGNTGDFASIVGAARYRRGRWAIWSRLASYNYTNTSGTVFGTVDTLTTKIGARLLNRGKNVLGAPNTTTGGISFDYLWAGLLGGGTNYPGVSTADVLVAYFRSPTQFDVYYGTYTSDWPLMENMTYMGSANVSGSASSWNASSEDMRETSMNIQFQLGSSAATTGTYEIIFDRWRLTTWE